MRGRTIEFSAYLNIQMNPLIAQRGERYIFFSSLSLSSQRFWLFVHRLSAVNFRKFDSNIVL